MLGEDRKWLFLLIHLAIPLLDIAVVLMVFPLMKPYLIKGIREKCEDPDIDREG